jgi:hypothetical protein
MTNQNTGQKFFFAWLVFLLLLTARVLLVTKPGVLLLSIAVLAFTVWTTFRLVGCVTGVIWTFAGVLAEGIVRKPQEKSAENKGALERQ